MDKVKEIYDTVSKMPKNQLTLVLSAGVGIGVGVATMGYYIYNKAREQFEDAQQYGDNDGAGDSNSWTGARRSSIYSVDSNSSRANWCSICLMDLTTDAGNLRRLPDCDHEFHEICVNTWFERNNTCPVCRQEINL